MWGNLLLSFSMVSSQNYDLSLPESDKDYKLIELPSPQDLFYQRKLTRQIDDNTSVWDVRDFGKQLMKANPNALEFLFSTEQEYYDEKFSNLMRLFKDFSSALIRYNWKNFSSAVKGLAFHSIQRNSVSPKTVSRFIYFYDFLERTAKALENNGLFTEEEWRPQEYEWPNYIRKHVHLTEEDINVYEEYIRKWGTFDKKLIPSEADKNWCALLEYNFENYFCNQYKKEN